MNWISKIPQFDPQYSQSDVYDCVEESLVHIVDMLTGQRYSPRALAWLMYREGLLTTNGSDVTNALNVANKYGFIPYDLWPTPAVFSYAQYFEPVPDSVLAQAHHYKVDLIDPDLDKSPLWLQLSFPDGAGANFLHMVAQINDTQYFDSESGGAVKTIGYAGGTPYHFKGSIKLTFDSMKLVNDNGTVYLVGELGKLGIADPDSLNKVKQLTAQIEDGSTAEIPQIGTLTHNDAYVIHN